MKESFKYYENQCKELSQDYEKIITNLHKEVHNWKTKKSEAEKEVEMYRQKVEHQEQLMMQFKFNVEKSNDHRFEQIINELQNRNNSLMGENDRMSRLIKKAQNYKR